MTFLLDENVPYSIKGTINNLGHEPITLKDETQLGIKNGEVAELQIVIKAIISKKKMKFIINLFLIN